MEHTHTTHSEKTEPPPFWRSRYAVGLLVFAAVATYFLLSEHRAHFIGALPFLLLLACPFMHIFMHHGHDEHGGDHESRGSGDQSLQRPSIPQANDAGTQP